MKTKVIYLTMMLMFMSVTTMFGQVKTEEVKVYGNCGMCKTRIEKAVKAVDGVTKATWDKETQMLSVAFDTEKTNVDAIQKAVAEVGHDTDAYKAKNETYNALPGCCKYERPVLKEIDAK